MNAIFEKSALHGSVQAPPSKSMTHRLLICAAMNRSETIINGVEYSDDILATVDCLKALGAEIKTCGDTLTVNGTNFLNAASPQLNARESGSTLRFLLPFAWLCRGEAVIKASERLLERPLDVYEEIAKEYGFKLEKSGVLTTSGTLKGGNYTVRGDISSQFISGLAFALCCIPCESTITVTEPFESRPYVEMTISALKLFGNNIDYDGNIINIKGGYSVKSALCRISVEGDWSNSAFLDVYNYLGGNVSVNGLNDNSLQGDKIYREYFKAIKDGTPTLDLSYCPDLAPILIALAAAKNGARFTGTRRLAAKESDRGKAMAQELLKFGIRLELAENKITVPKGVLSAPAEALSGHNDHRIVMAFSTLLTVTGGKIDGAEAVKKSFPSYFNVLKELGANVTLTY
ncbi:MAG: 3-phosphoshikimate 1-carboxyvinyltransferase [Clostridia bacterium]|nr:3-phosphoshikimate 1-carboxyvinyltransferase [Clostridia bacterium]